MSDEDGSSSGKPKKICVLLADNDTLIMNDHQTLLMDTFNMEVETVRDGKEIVSSYSEGCTYDILVLDQKMPVLDGIKVTKTLRQMEVKSKIVGLYDYFDEDEVNAFIEAGLDICIKKPLTEEKIKAILKVLYE